MKISDMNSFRVSLRLHPRSILRTLLEIMGVMVALQAITVIVLQIVSVQRRRLQQPGSFPHPQMKEVCVGENKLEIYNYGRDLYDAMLAAIDAAQESIYLETYIWKDDAIGQAFKEHLANKADQGVEVYVIFDSFGNMVVPRKFKVFPPNIHVLPYQAIQHPWHLFDLRRYALDHRKLLVVDGTTSFIGGYNLGSLYATQWRDTHLRLRGPGATELARAFIGFWNRFCPADEQITERYHHQFDALITVSQNE